MDLVAALTWLHCLHTLFVLPLSMLWSLRQLVFMGPDLPCPRRRVAGVHLVWALSPMLGAAVAAMVAIIGVNEYGVHEEIPYIFTYVLLLVPISASWVWSLRRSSPFDEASIDEVRAALFGVSLWTASVLGVTLFWWFRSLTTL